MKGFPGSLLSLDLWVRKNVPGIESTILDEEETLEQNLRASLESKLADAPQNPYFGLTSTTATYQDALATAKALKEIRPNSKIILGGHHVDSQEQIILDNHLEIDITVTGEGEKALEGILSGDYDVPGVTYRNRNLLDVSSNPKNKGIRLTPEELDTLDIREFNSKYQDRATQFEEVNLITARGCPMACYFCAVANEKANTQNPDLVIEQIDYLVKQMEKKGEYKPIAIQDNFFAQKKRRAMEVARKLIDYREQTGNKFEWNMQTRVEQFADSELAPILAKAGCSAAYFGVENFDQRMLKILNKAHNESEYLISTSKAIQNCLANGIQPHIDFQVGIQGEDPETKKINESALRHIGEEARAYDKKPIVFPSLSVVYPATVFYKGMMQLGAPKDIYEKFTKWERENPEYRGLLHGYFAHGNGGIPLGIMDIDKLKEGEISVNMDKLFRVKRYVDRLRKLEDVIVHDYKNPIREKED
jgi:radical SAM superfamily enzyme YgiQ (UPF0313 family)|tara:strand:- start:491 stop:1915 length:1425 start_codon:yes stop_codon:yes gene_type:complete